MAKKDESREVTVADDIRQTLMELESSDDSSQERSLARSEDGGRQLSRRERQDSLSTDRKSGTQDEEDDHESSTDLELHPDEEEADDQPEPKRKGKEVTDPLDIAPVSWKGKAKTEWVKLPEAARSEIHRRDREVTVALSRTDNQRKYAEAVFNAIAPYEHYIRAEGATHVQAIDSLFQMAHIMRSGTPQQKAELIVELFFRHNIDITQVDALLTAKLGGQQPGGQPTPSAQMTQLIQAELAPIKEFMQGINTTRQQSTQQVRVKAAEDITKLMEDPLIGDLIEDVRDDIADLMMLATKRGQILPLRDAAMRAIMAHPDLEPVLRKRQQRSAAQRDDAAARRGKRAGASLENDGAPSSDEEETDDDSDGSVRSDILSSVKQLSRQRR